MSTKRIINVIKVKCHEAPERAPDYHKALLDTVSDVVGRAPTCNSRNNHSKDSHRFV